jgi:adiponectin receptor
MLYYGFHCDEFLQTVYLVLGTAVVVIVWLSLMFSPMAMPSMPILFIVAAVGILQGFHEFFYHGPGSERSWIVVECYIKSWGCYGMGVVFYASQIPEAWFPGRFDFIGHSHMFWHVCVTAGAFVQYNNAQIYRARAAVC